jgi:hypothetical protein
MLGSRAMHMMPACASSRALCVLQAVGYWDSQEASYDGVLGGFGHVSDVDVRDSRQLLEKVGLRVCVASRTASFTKSSRQATITMSASLGVSYSEATVSKDLLNRNVRDFCHTERDTISNGLGCETRLSEHVGKRLSSMIYL